MLRSTRMLRHGLFAAATMAALGFGATQALAAPRAEADAARACSNLNHAQCRDSCRAMGYDTGSCVAGGGCWCVHY